MRCLFQSYSCASIDMMHFSLLLHVLVMSIMLHTSADSYPFAEFPLRNNIDEFPKLVSSQNLDSSDLKILNNQDQAFEKRGVLSMLRSTPHTSGLNNFPSSSLYDDVATSASILLPKRKRRRRRQASRTRNGEIISLPSSSSIEQKYKVQTRESEEIIIPSLMNFDGPLDTRLLFPGDANYLKTRNGIPSKNPQTAASSKVVLESDKISFPEEADQVAKRGGWLNSKTLSSNKTKTTATTQSSVQTQSNLQPVFFPDSLKSEEEDYDNHDKDNMTNTSSIVTPTFQEFLSKLKERPEEDKQKQGENETNLQLGFEFHSLLSASDRENKCRDGIRVHGRCRKRHG